uniref:Uncharacterized protein n=1 Tax=Anguilla anguilla TaxID=7936 RepID=A0A0E9XM78_ANGAN
MKQGLTCHILIVALLPLLVLTQVCLTKVRRAGVFAGFCGFLLINSQFKPWKQVTWFL